jgi:hypothetical protein
MLVLVRNSKNRVYPTPVRCTLWVCCAHQCSVGTPLTVWIDGLEILLIRAGTRNQADWLKIDLLLIRLPLLCYHYVSFSNCRPRYLDLPQMVIRSYMQICVHCYIKMQELCPCTLFRSNWWLSFSKPVATDGCQNTVIPDYITRSLMICSAHQILFGWSNQKEWVGRGM